MVEQVTMWRSQDGTLHASAELAEQHDQHEKMVSDLRARLIPRNCRGDHADDHMTPGQVIRLVVRYRADVVRILTNVPEHRRNGAGIEMPLT